MRSTGHGRMEVDTGGLIMIAEAGAEVAPEAGATESGASEPPQAQNLILTKGNTLLAEEEINMSTVLRMNRRFMEFMRKYHPDAANQRFKMTVISEDFAGSSD